MFGTQKAKTFVIIASLVLLLTTAICVSSGNVKAQSTQCKISGYVLDANGHGIVGADVIFNSPTTVPGVTTDTSGYYQTSGPSGTYHMNIWPPFDSSYISYDQPGFVVASDVTKNVTLNLGYKVSGTISDASGAPVVGACVFLNGSGSGWFSTSAGYYFVAVPAGTYTINAHPRTDSYSSGATQFPAYYEYNFAVTGNTIKNLVVGTATSPTPTPAPDGTKYQISGYITDSNGNGLANAEIIFNVPSTVPSVFSDGTGHYTINAPAGTYHVNVWPPYDSHYIDYDQTSYTVTADATKNITLQTGCKVSGTITDYSGNPISGATIWLSYGNINYCTGWFSKTNGYYFTNAPAGTYTLNVHSNSGAFPTYIENNFIVNSDVTKNIKVGTAPTSTPTPTITQTPVPTQNPVASPTPTHQLGAVSQPTITPNPTQQAPNQNYAVNPQTPQPNENSLEYSILIAAIAVVSVIALMTLVWVYRGKQAVNNAMK